MSLIPLIFSDWWEDLDRPHRLVDQNFGFGIRPEQLLVEAHAPRRFRGNYIRPWAEALRHVDSGTSTVKCDKDKFQVSLDVQQFKPEEINVKVVDKCVVVEGKHEEKQDEHGYISRQFTRKYLIPEQCDVSQVASTLSSDGVLNITAPRLPAIKDKGEKTIQIQHTGQPAVRDNGSQKMEVDQPQKKKK